MIMRTLSASELLNVWERGLAEKPFKRALTLLTAACPETPPEELAKLRIGRRDALLLTLREWTFGPQLICLATCPGCGERLELAYSVVEIRAGMPAQSSTDQEGVTEADGALSVKVEDYEVQFRLPNSLDLAAVARGKDVGETRHLLFMQCLLEARQTGEKRAAEQLPANIVDAVAERMAVADPQADAQVDLSCPLCSHEWRADFDIVSFFWSEINAWATRILRDVHTLASVYGWREADVLAMSAWRRQCYLEMARG
jgi:hypothetical protein